MLDKMQKRPYTIEPYNPEWVTRFNEIKAVVANVFKDKVIAIEHIGSTSIPGMKAKPVIDLLLIVQKMEPFAGEREEMAKFGYESDTDYIIPGSMIFVKTDADTRKTVNIHVCVEDSYKATQFLIMRDYLRAHPQQAKSYSELKETLNTKFPDDYPSYREGKHAFLDEIERLAMEWKKR
jgi:GrpB-like predicted nucleotidyltransferase (UPF0157 family)